MRKNFEMMVSTWENKTETIETKLFQLPSCIKTEESAKIYADLFSIERLTSALSDMTVTMLSKSKAAVKAATPEEKQALMTEVAKLQSGIDACESACLEISSKLEVSTGKDLADLRVQFPFLAAHAAYFSTTTGVDSNGKKITAKVGGIKYLIDIADSYMREFGNTTPDVATWHKRRKWEAIRKEAETIVQRWFDFPESPYVKACHADLKAWQVNLVITAVTGKAVISNDGYGDYKTVSDAAFQKAFIGILFKRLLPEKPVSVKTGKQETII